RSPMARAASTNSRSRRASTSPRITRAKRVQSTITMARMTFQSPSPRTAISAIARRTAGIDIQTSTTRMSAVSIRPRTYPARSATGTPTSAEMAALATATTTATRAPQRSRERMSRPRLSVPRACRQAPPAHTGGWRTEIRSCRFGSCGASAGPANARTSSKSAIAAPAQSFAFTGSSLRQPDARIQEGVRHVDRQVGEDDRDGIDEHDPLDQWKVPVLERLESQLPDARPGEDGLDQHRPADQEAELDPDQR